LRKCRGCLACDLHIKNEMDISYGILAQMILMNDESVLESNLIWDQASLENANSACKTVNLQKVFEGLRQIAKERNI